MREMAMVKCQASGCESTGKSGKIFFQCNKCGRWWCRSHGHNGKKCICGGFMKQP